MSDSRQPGTPGLVLVAVLYGLVPPAGLLAGLYGASRLLGVAFRGLVFVLTVVAVISWYLVAGSAQPRGTISNKYVTSIDWTMVGLGGGRITKTGASDDGGILSRTDVAHLLSPSYLTLVLTITAIVGWVAVLLA